MWLPIDAKFPKEDYERLVEASERGDVVAVEQPAKDLAVRVYAEARDIREKRTIFLLSNSAISDPP